MSHKPPHGSGPSDGAELAELARANARLSAEIDERRRAETTLRQSEERFAKAFRSDPDALIISRLSDGAVMEVNHSYEQMLGYEAAEIIGKNRRTLQLAPDTAARDKLLQRLMSDGSYRDEELQLRRRSGAIRDVRISAETIDIGGEVCVLARLRDITEQKQAERAFLASEERLRMALAAAKMGIWEWIISTDQVIWSAEVGPIFGLARGESVDSLAAFLDHVHPDDRAAIAGRVAELIEQPRTGESYDVEHRIVWPSGETRWVASKGSVIFDSSGIPVRMLGTVMDATERRQAEEQAQRHLAELWRMGRIKAADQMAASLAHELNQPLTAIALQAGIVSSLVPAEDDQVAPQLILALSEIGEQARRAGGIVRSLRNLVKKGDTRRSPTQLNEIVGEVVDLIEPLARHQHVGVNLELRELPLICVDRIQIAQILMNLFQNSIEAMRECDIGERRLEVATAPFDERAVLLSVRDTGTGIAPEICDRVFDRFYTTNPEGIGVGLAICRSIADAHGGKIWFSSTVGEGTIFYLRLPIAEQDELA